ncbi:MAG: L-rhamnose isomerase [Lachnospiraceae bacterium]|nr:L-rhamnose isomerase [Lachnospiraceae bacterium]
MNQEFESAKKYYGAYGVDAEKAMALLDRVPVSIHCWQLDDVQGFDSDGPLTGGIQTTGNYPGKARNPEELFRDYEKVLSLIPGAKKLNVHANYAIFGPDGFVDRDKLEPRHFAPWVEFAKKHGLGIDFNPTFFSHPKANGMTLCSEDEEIRSFWVRHGRACIRISQYFAEETGIPSVINFWTGDGLKDIPADRLGPRMRYVKSMDEILEEPFDREKVYVTFESKVFGIGVESYTCGSAETTLLYAATRHITPLMDNGHYHPTEVVSDKISALLCYFDKIALHVTRPVRWDSDHVVRLDDETEEIMKEIVRNDALDRVFIATDYFDASINRIAALAMGVRNVKKALLKAMLLPNDTLLALQEKGEYTALFELQERMKTAPFGYVWEEYLKRAGVPGEAEWFKEVQKYECDVLSQRK